MKKAKIKNLEVDLDKIQNPKLRGIIEDRCQSFLFNFKKKRRRGDDNYTEHTDENCHNDIYGDYSERATHTDVTAGPIKSRSHTEHKDYTDHSDSPHSEYNEHMPGSPDYGV